MIIKRSKRIETTFDMVAPGEVFEDDGTWYMRLSPTQMPELDENYGYAAELITGNIVSYHRIEECPVIVIPGEFVAKG